MRTRVFIMSQGIQSRMKRLAIRKQMLEVGGEYLIGRITRQCVERGVTPIAVAWPDLHSTVESYGAEAMELRYPGVCIIDGMHATSPWWIDDRNIFLLGDVVYSDAAMDTIFKYQGDVQFFGTHDVGRATGELFGFVANGRKAVNNTAELILVAPCRGVYSPKGQGGHLRILLFSWMQLRGLHPRLPCEYHEDILTVIGDWTSDIDTDNQVAELLPILEEHVREERKSLDG